eukprot:2315032-Amphidinium_carterae.1
MQNAKAKAAAMAPWQMPRSAPEAVQSRQFPGQQAVRSNIFFQQFCMLIKTVEEFELRGKTQASL